MDYYILYGYLIHIIYYMDICHGQFKFKISDKLKEYLAHKYRTKKHKKLIYQRYCKNK